MDWMMNTPFLQNKKKVSQSSLCDINYINALANNVRDCICKNKTYQECREQFTNPGPKVSGDCISCLENCNKSNTCDQCFEDSDGNKTFFKLWQNNQSMMCYNNMTDHMVPNIGEKNSPWCGIVEKMKCNLKEIPKSQESMSLIQDDDQSDVITYFNWRSHQEKHIGLPTKQESMSLIQDNKRSKQQTKSRNMQQNATKTYPKTSSIAKYEYDEYKNSLP